MEFHGSNLRVGTHERLGWNSIFWVNLAVKAWNQPLEIINIRWIQIKVTHLKASNFIINPRNYTWIITRIVKEIPNENIERWQRKLGCMFPWPSSFSFARQSKERRLWSLRMTAAWSWRRWGLGRWWRMFLSFLTGGYGGGAGNLFMICSLIW